MPSAQYSVRETNHFLPALFTLSDLAYVLLPCSIVWKLNMPLRQKISITILMAASLFTMAASIAKTVITQTAAATGSQKGASIAFMWTAVEQSMVIIMSCVPPLRSVTKLNPRIFRALKLTDGDPVSKPLSYGTDLNGDWSVNKRSRAGRGQYYTMSMDGDTTATPRVAAGCEGPRGILQDRFQIPHSSSMNPESEWGDRIVKTNEITIHFDQPSRV